MKITRLKILTGLAIILTLNATISWGSNVPDQFNDVLSTVLDTIPMQDRTGDFINDSYNNPFELMPSIITQEVEYDAKTNQYILVEKIGDEYYRPPTYMTFDEYMDWKAKDQEREYFNNLAGIKSRKPSLTGKIDPMDKIDVSKSLVDKMFGGTEVTIKPQGNVDLTLGLVDYRKTTGANITPQAAEQLFIPGDFRIQPRLNVDGAIGKKLNLGFNYDSNATFDFDKKIKLEYSADAFNEDDIIKKIEAGNVSLPLNSNLIQGAQSLFGFKTEVQFGHLRLTGIMSQQRSKKNTLTIENGASVQEFDLTPDEYDENRHFFLSQYHRDHYEEALQNLPQINSSFRAVQIEVWVTNDRREYQENSTPIAALADLAEGNINNYHNDMPTGYQPNFIPQNSYLRRKDGALLPENDLNPLFNSLVTRDDANELDKVQSILTTEFNQKQTRDFEIYQGRLLSQNEYTYHPQLGFISLNFRLRPNQALGVSYKYYYTDVCDSVYTVGQLMSEGAESSEAQFNRDTVNQEPEASKVIFVKMLKSTNEQVKYPMWDLMMKNVYNLRTSNLTKEGFTFDIYYEDDADDGSLKKYIPDNSKSEITPLLNLFNLDTLNRFGDPQSDGVFDFVPGVTVIERSGSIVFPVLEPYGSSLAKLGYDSSYIYQELYDTTQAIAQANFIEKNKFIMRARVENATSGEINLGPSIPQGGVSVRAGGVTLVEGQDYEIDYSLGRLRILNPAYLDQGTPINVSYEDNGAFNLNTKIMKGLRADYEVSKKLSVGATYLRLHERPFTQKVNIGNDPINNRIFGLDLNYNDELPWLTSLVDKLPFYSTKAASSVAITAEGAYLRPGHNKNINLNSEDGGVVSIDDFEGAVSGFTLGGFNINAWTFASTPSEFAESSISEGLVNGYNRAKLNWYQIDESARSGTDNRFDAYTRTVDLQELFDRQVDLGQTRLYTFDLSYYPTERGVYNFDPIDGSIYSAGLDVDVQNKKINLKDPKSRWGGIMRSFQNTDFETANYEFIEFWVLNPFMEGSGGESQLDGERGEMVFQLGNVSEDIIKDNLQFFENGIPDSDNLATIPVRNTQWGKVSLRVPLTNGFNVNTISEQDVGLDGISDDEEKVLFEDYYTKFPATFTEVYQDPAADNFLYYNDEDLLNSGIPLLERFKGFNNPQGNAPLNNIENNSSRYVRGNSDPETEDLNGNRTLDQAENYFEYRIPMRNNQGELDTANNQFYRETRVVTRPGQGGAVTEKWYRFQVPLNQNTGATGDISNFRSIQFMRMYLTEFEKAKTFRLADFQLVRNLWRKSLNRCGSDEPTSSKNLTVDKVGLQENSTRLPFNYLSPSGIQQEQLLGTVGNIAQDEKSMVLKFEQLTDTCEVGVNKLARLNLTQYKKLQLFVHAEEDLVDMDYGDLSIFVRVGKDLVDNYYEYELPLEISDPFEPSLRSNIWPDTNFVDLELSKFLDVKKAKLSGGGQTGLNGTIEIDDPDNLGAKIRVIGNPSLGLVKIIEVGVRNTSGRDEALRGQVWINELRCVGLEERGGVAGQARMQVKMADLGEINLSANYSSIGFGALDQRLEERNQEEIIEYDIATTMQLGKILPQVLKLNLPFYAQYSKSISNPRFDPYQLDLTTNEVAELADASERDDIRERAQSVTTIKSFNVTNAKIDVGKGKMPWSPKNFSTTYAWTEKESKDPIIASEKETETKLGLDYRYSMKPLYIKPMTFIKSKYLKFLSEFNFNLIPNTFSFNTLINRFNNTKVFRLPESGIFQFDDKRYKWDRNYNLDWDIAKSLRFTFKAQTSSIVDELRQVGINQNPDDRPWIDANGQDSLSVNDTPIRPYTADDEDQYRVDNLKSLGRSKFYQHDIGLSYRVPFKTIPFMDWITTTADYKAQYVWNGGSLIRFDDGTPLGSVIQNSQTRSLNTNLGFDKIYKKSKYLQMIENGGKPSRTRGRTSRSSRSSSRVSKDAKGKDAKEEKKEDRVPSLAERIIIRPFLSLRSVKFAYREDLGTSVPGFQKEAGLFGMENFTAPGWDFTAGLQPDLDKNSSNNWLKKNVDNNWFNNSPQFNEQISQSKQHNITAKIKLEPFKDFDIDIDFSKNYRRDHTEIFKQLSKADDNGLIDTVFAQSAMYDIGSFEVTHFGLNTLFKNNVDLLNQFKQNRVLVSNSLENKANAGVHPDSDQFAEGYGPLSYAVNVPAFMAAYTGNSVDSTNIVDKVSAYSYIPKPNWQIRYDGLSKLKMFKKVFKSFQLKHGYKSTMAVSRFNSNVEYREDTRFSEKSEQNQNYYSELEIPAMTIVEQFNPIIGVSVKTQNDIKINAEWKKTRRLNLNLQASNLSEDLSNEFVFGFGYVIKNFKGFTSKKKKKRTRKKDEEEEKDKDKIIDFSRGGLVTNEKGRTLTINLDMSFRDNINIIYELTDATEGEPSRGQKAFMIEPSLEYQLYKNLALRWFGNYQTSKPYNTEQNGFIAFQTGFTVRFNFN